MRKAILQSETITVGETEIQVFVFLDGEYRFNRNHVLSAVDTTSEEMTQYLQSGEVKTLLNDDWFSKDEIDHLLPLSIVTAFWLKQAINGNSKAKELICTGIEELLEMLADKIFSAKYSR
jgi:hypothetical protein